MAKKRSALRTNLRNYVVQQKRVMVSAQFGGVRGLLYIFSPAPSHVVPCFLSFRKCASYPHLKTDKHENLLHWLFL